jgi:hypothetical protein
MKRIDFLKSLFVGAAVAPALANAKPVKKGIEKKDIDLVNIPMVTLNSTEGRVIFWGGINTAPSITGIVDFKKS